MAVYSNGLIPLIQAYDMPASLRFYRDLLGFQVVASSPKLGEDLCHWVRLRLGDAEFMLNTAYEFDHELPAVRDPARIQAHGDTGLFIAVPDVDAA